MRGARFVSLGLLVTRTATGHVLAHMSFQCPDAQYRGYND